MPNLPHKVLSGANILAPHFCSNQYLKDNKKRLQFGVSICVSCTRFPNEPNVSTKTTMRFVNDCRKTQAKPVKSRLQLRSNSRKPCATILMRSNANKSRTLAISRLFRQTLSKTPQSSRVLATTLKSLVIPTRYLATVSRPLATALVSIPPTN